MKILYDLILRLIELNFTIAAWLLLSKWCLLNYELLGQKIAFMLEFSKYYQWQKLFNVLVNYLLETSNLKIVSDCQVLMFKPIIILFKDRTHKYFKK